jgi:hypothetical protein
VKHWWEPRRKGEPTATFLGRVLDELDLPRMAERARLGHFDDYFAPAEVADGLEILRLHNELLAEAKRPACGAERRGKIKAVAEAVKEGEFDGTKEESDRWAASKDGQDAFRELVEGR